MESVPVGGDYQDGFITRNGVGVLTNADSLPTVQVYRNGVVDGSVPTTVTNVSTGVYRYLFTIPPGYTPNDVVQPLISATVGGILNKEWGDTSVVVTTGFSDPFASMMVALQTGLPESYRATMGTGSIAQLLYELVAHLGNAEFAAAVKRLLNLAQSQVVKTFTVNDVTNPTAISETT